MMRDINLKVASVSQILQSAIQDVSIVLQVQDKKMQHLQFVLAVQQIVIGVMPVVARSVHKVITKIMEGLV